MKNINDKLRAVAHKERNVRFDTIATYASRHIRAVAAHHFNPPSMLSIFIKRSVRFANEQ